MTIAEHIGLQAQRSPEKVVVEVMDPGGNVIDRLTYVQAWERIRRIGRAVEKSKLGRYGRLVPGIFGNTADGILAYPGCWEGRAGLVEINTRLSDGELRYILDDCDAQTVLCDRLNLERTRALCTGTSRDIICVDDLPPSAEVEVRLSDRPLGEDIALVVYTSGTTGFPKGVLMSHDMLLTYFYRQAWCFGLTNEHVLLTAGPVFHLSFESFSLIALMWGIRNRLMTGFNAETAARELADGCSAAFLVPTMLRSVLDVWESNGRHPLASARWILSMGATLPGDLVERAIEAFPNAKIAEAYGFAEAGIVTYEIKEPGHLQEQSVGQTLPGCDIAVFDDLGRRCSIGEPGNVAGLSAVPFCGYLGKPEESAAIMRGNYALGGDLGVIQSDGRLRLLGRKHDLIVSGGENVYAAEVERVLMMHDGVEEVAIFGWPDDEWGEVVSAAVVGSPDIDDTVLDRHCREYLAGYKVPRRYAFLKALPRNAMGKVQKGMLRELCEAGTDQVR